jgi:hypothetical protein
MTNNPIQQPTYAPAELGVQLANKRISDPVEPWMYILPLCESEV